MSLFTSRREPSAVDVLLAQLTALGQQVAALQADVAALKAARPALAPTTVTSEPEPPSALDLTPIYAVVDAIAPDEGPMRRHLMRTAFAMLRNPDETPDSVADLLARGSDDD